jgi:hypothetical protein
VRGVLVRLSSLTVVSITLNVAQASVPKNVGNGVIRPPADVLAVIPKGCAVDVDIAGGNVSFPRGVAETAVAGDTNMDAVPGGGTMDETVIAVNERTGKVRGDVAPIELIIGGENRRIVDQTEDRKACGGTH